MFSRSIILLCLFWKLWAGLKLGTASGDSPSFAGPAPAPSIDEEKHAPINVWASGRAESRTVNLNSEEFFEQPSKNHSDRAFQWPRSTNLDHGTIDTVAPTKSRGAAEVQVDGEGRLSYSRVINHEALSQISRHHPPSREVFNEAIIGQPVYGKRFPTGTDEAPPPKRQRTVFALGNILDSPVVLESPRSISESTDSMEISEEYPVEPSVEEEGPSARTGAHTSVISSFTLPSELDQLPDIDMPLLGNDKTLLHIGSSLGHVGLVEYAIRRGADVNKVSENGDTSISMAISGDHEEVAGALLRAGADVGLENKQKVSPLHMALLRGHEGILTLLLENMKRRDKVDRNSPMHLAALLDKGQTIDHLLRMGFDPNLATFEEGLTPLHIAATHGSLEAAQALLDGGAKVNARDHWYRTPLILSARGQLQDMLLLLLRAGADVNAQELDDSCPLSILVEQRKWNWAHELLQFQVHEGMCDKGKENLLMRLAFKADKEAVSFLLSHNFDPNLGNRYDWRPIHRAVESEDLDTVRLLVDSGADVNLASNRGMTALHLAAAKGNEKLIQLLIESGADVNASEQRHGFTPLHFAFRTNRPGVLGHLLAAGADVTTLNKNGESPLHVACRKGKLEEVSEMLNTGKVLQNLGYPRELVDAIKNRDVLAICSHLQSMEVPGPAA